MDILNFISWIRGGRKVTTVDPDKTLVPIGIKDSRRGDGYLAAAITVTDLANYICGGGNCCSNETIVTLSFTPSNTGFSGIILSFFCDGTLITQNVIDETALNLTNTVFWLNFTYGTGDGAPLPLIGNFSLDDGTIVLTMTECKKQSICPTGELTFSILPMP